MWLYIPIPSTSSASAPAAAGSISASDWRCQMLTRSCWWRGKPSPSATWSQRLNKVSWLRRLSGAMCEPSTADHGVASWMASLAASRASLIPSPESGSERKTNATCGATQGGSSFNPAPGSSSSKTSKACSPPAAPNVSSETFADCVIRLRSDYSARQKRAQAISATACLSSLWPTAKVLQGDPNSKREERGAGGPDLQEMAVNWPTPSATEDRQGFQRRPEGMASQQNQQSLTTVAMQWTTPSAGDGQRGGTITEAMSGTSLAQQVNSLWSTPRSSDAEKGSPNQSFGAGGIPLPAQASQWPTPTSLNFDKSHQPGNSHSYNRTMELAKPISDQWQAPAADSFRSRGGDRKDELGLDQQARCFLPDHPISTDGEESSKIRRTLNPLFVEWLMGWPPNWTLLALNACACSATELSAWKLRMRSALFSLGLPPMGRPQQLSLFG